MKQKNITPLCPCGTGIHYDQCCGAVHLGQAAASAEALMRSRYSAYALGLSDYLRRSWHHSTRPQQLSLDKNTQWFKLKIVDIHAGRDGDTKGIVSFEARYKVNGKASRLSEMSEFVLEQNQWFYVGEK
jgi:SEC-C motif-containing protein